MVRTYERQIEATLIPKCFHSHTLAINRKYVPASNDTPAVAYAWAFLAQADVPGLGWVVLPKTEDGKAGRTHTCHAAVPCCWFFDASPPRRCLSGQLYRTLTRHSEARSHSVSKSWWRTPSTPPEVLPELASAAHRRLRGCARLAKKAMPSPSCNKGEWKCVTIFMN